MRKILVVMADIHSGDNQGLMPPDVQLLDDTGPEPRVWTPAQTAIQREWLWPNYVRDMGSVFDLAGKSEVTLALPGDLTQGNKYHDGLVSSRMADQFTIALANLEPWYAHKNLKNVYLVQGTGAHEFGEGSAPVVLSEVLAKRYPKVRTAYHRHYLLDVDGALVDIAHHGPAPSKRAWLKENMLRYYTKSLMFDEIIAGRAVPAAIVRAHVHEPIKPQRVWVGDYKCEAVVVPCYCGITTYVMQVARSPYILHCGLVALEFVDGALREVYPFWRSVDLRQREAV